MCWSVEGPQGSNGPFTIAARQCSVQVNKGEGNLGVYQGTSLEKELCKYFTPKLFISHRDQQIFTFFCLNTEPFQFPLLQPEDPTARKSFTHKDPTATRCQAQQARQISTSSELPPPHCPSISQRVPPSRARPLERWQSRHPEKFTWRNLTELGTLAIRALGLTGSWKTTTTLLPGVWSCKGGLCLAAVNRHRDG